MNSLFLILLLSYSASQAQPIDSPVTEIEDIDYVCYNNAHQVLLNVKYQRLWIDAQFLTRQGTEPQIFKYRNVGDSSLYIEGQFVEKGEIYPIFFILRGDESVMWGVLDIYGPSDRKINQFGYDCFAYPVSN